MSLNSESESIIRYYNSDDVANVLSALSAAENSSAYADICRSTSKYWELSLINMQPGKPGPLWVPSVDREPCPSYHQITSSERIGVVEDRNWVHNWTKASDGCPGDRVAFHQKDYCIKEGGNVSGLEMVDKPNLPDNFTEDDDLGINKIKEAANGTLFPAKDEQFMPEATTLTVDNALLPSVATDFSEQLGSRSVLTETSQSSQHISVERLSFPEIAICVSVNEEGTPRENEAGLISLIKRESVSVANESRFECHSNDKKYAIAIKKDSRSPFVFKPQSYVNQYIQGDLAASAAANLALLASDGSKVSEAHVSSNPRKAVAATTALQMRVFSAAVMNFFWPGDKKLMEIPRERCGWCIACKTASTCKKGCLLNLAATNAIKRSGRNFSALRPVKQVGNHIPVIGAQIAHMEETLRGLTTGPLSDAQYNKQWHKLAREASSCKVLKYLLLEVSFFVITFLLQLLYYISSV